MAQRYTFIRSSSEQEWLEARTRMLTATDMARMMSGGPVVMERVADEKRTPPAPLHPTKALTFGHEREPVMLAQVNKNYGINLIHNTDVGHLVSDPRMGGTPDAISEDMSYIGECKTFSGIRTEVPKEHYFQCMWNMFIFGAEKCYYIVEEHVDFVPTDPQNPKVWIIERDDAVIADMVAKAEEFFDNYEVEKTSDADLDAIIEEYRQVLADEKAVKKRKSDLQEKVRNIKGAFTEFGYTSDAGSISAAFAAPRLTMDTKRLMAEKPEIVEEYGKYSTSKMPSLRITPKKISEDK